VKLAVIGVGHVGLVSAACLARWGHQVVGLDADEERIALLRSGHVPFHEPNLPELVAEGVAAGRLRFTDDLADAVADVEAVFVCVGTPSLPNGAPDLRLVEQVARDVTHVASQPLVLIEKSTVPAQTGDRLAGVVRRERHRRGDAPRIRIASNPEFLREGSAVADTLHPDRVVVGADDEEALEVLRRIYTPVTRDDVPMVETDVATAELIKHASNAMLATKISFINAVARVCDAVGADVDAVAHGMGLDPRIGPSFLRAGMGYGGSCFPKDVDAFIHLARSVGTDFRLLEEVRAINDGQRELVLDALRDELWHLAGKTVTLLGAAYKPDTDDLRCAPAIWLAEQLIDEGATVRIYDPVATRAVGAAVPKATVMVDPLEACEGAHAAVVCTEWEQVRELAPRDLRDRLAYPIVVDGRNAYEPDAMLAAGLRYRAIGRDRRQTFSLAALEQQAVG
jgi:UDPglucose 6-dehydrogenase